jgi:hypothetical protein
MKDYDGPVPDGKALAAFESYVRGHPMMGLMPDVFLKKMTAHDDNNPQFFNGYVDMDWQMFLRGFEAARSEFASK